MNIPCNIVSPCLLVNPPYLNLSSEAPDQIVFFGFSWGGGFGGSPGGSGTANPGGPLDNCPGQPFCPGVNPGNPGTSGSGDPPPLGTFWTQWSCLGTCVSFLSQMDADMCAILASLECLYDSGPGSDPNYPPPNNPGTGNPYTLFFNQAQTATAICSDGTGHSFTVPAFTFSSISQVQANTKAMTFAQSQASAINHCPPTRSCCLGVPLGTTFDVYNVHSLFFGTADFSFSVTSGTLPDGVTLQKTGPQTARLVGEPTKAGVFNWTVTARRGNYTITMPDVVYVLGVNDTTLPAGVSGQAYSQQVPSAGNKGDVVFTPGAFFPSWASISSTGLITGTPP